jgi:outer membrane protein assembly factor BamB
LYVVTVANSGSRRFAVVRSLSKQTGVTNWSESLPASIRFFLGATASGLVVVSDSGQIEFRSSENGEIVHQTAVSGPITAEPFFTRDSVLIGTGQKALFVLAGNDGKVVAKKALKFVPTAISVTADEQIVTGDERGNLALRSARGDVQWNFKNGARIAAVGYTKHGILAVSLDNFVYLLSNGSGSVIWKRRLPGRVFGRPAVGGETIVVTTVADGRAFVIDVESGKLVNQLAVEEAENGGLQPILVDQQRLAFALPAEVRLYSSQACQRQ